MKTTKTRRTRKEKGKAVKEVIDNELETNRETETTDDRSGERLQTARERVSSQDATHQDVSTALEDRTEETRPGAVAVPGIDVEQPMVESDSAENNVPITAHVVDTHEEEKLRDELHELRRVVQDSVVVDAIPSDRDEETTNSNEESLANKFLDRFKNDDGSTKWGLLFLASLALFVFLPIAIVFGFVFYILWVLPSKGVSHIMLAKSDTEVPEASN